MNISTCSRWGLQSPFSRYTDRLSANQLSEYAPGVHILLRCWLLVALLAGVFGILAAGAVAGTATYASLYPLDGDLRDDRLGLERQAVTSTLTKRFLSEHLRSTRESQDIIINIFVSPIQLVEIRRLGTSSVDVAVAAVEPLDPGWVVQQVINSGRIYDPETQHLLIHNLALNIEDRGEAALTPIEVRRVVELAKRQAPFVWALSAACLAVLVSAAAVFVVLRVIFRIGLWAMTGELRFASAMSRLEQTREQRRAPKLH